MKKLILAGILILSLLSCDLFDDLFGSDATPTPGITPTSGTTPTPTPTPTPGPTFIEVEILSASLSPLPPGDITFNEGTGATMSATVKNNGRPISFDGNEDLYLLLVADSASGQGWDQLFINLEEISTETHQANLNTGEQAVFNFSVDLSSSPVDGPNYFYAITLIIDMNDQPSFLIDQDTSDNVYQLNYSPVNVIHPPMPYESWAGPSNLPGGVDADNAVSMGFDRWYTTTLDADSHWYEVSVTPGTTYTIFWDDADVGSGTYTSDVWVYVYESDGFTLYANEDSSYLTGLDIVPTETIILIEVYPAFNDGTLAIGITTPMP